ncbi:MAG: hypothetical protein PWP23_46 [Candidatus Sumerlaeota bacterium]|nr:hypothetical protein [Candidatus Sumerlaeota bacterium]
MGGMDSLPLAVRLRDAGRALADWFLPPVCMCCHSPVDPRQGDFLCTLCRADLRVLEAPACPCGFGRIPGDAERAACAFCKALPLEMRVAMTTVRSAFPYAGVVGDMVRNLKYRHHEHAGEALARLTMGVLSEHLVALRDVHGAEVVVPVPMHWFRRVKRGYNQAECIARPLAALLGLPCDSEAVLRARRTPPQARRASPEERLVNVAKAFAVPEPERVAARRVILVDDVMTTGATMATCAQALREAGASAVHAISVTRAGVGGVLLPGA